MKIRYYILIGILSYLFFTLGNVPAARVISLLEQNTAMPVKLYGVYGSLWNGGAEQATIRNQPPIDNLKWSINPASLLLAQLSGELNASIKQQNITGNFSIGPTGNISASDVRARADAELVQELIQLPLGELGGIFNLNIESLELNPEALPSVNGKLTWDNAQLTLMETVDLGNINLSVIPGDNNQLLATIKNKGGQLKLSGTADLNDKKMYSVDLTITPQDSATDNVRQSLKMFARRQSNGSYQVKRKGNLQEFGF